MLRPWPLKYKVHFLLYWLFLCFVLQILIFVGPFLIDPFCPPSLLYILLVCLRLVLGEVSHILISVLLSIGQNCLLLRGHIYICADSK